MASNNSTITKPSTVVAMANAMYPKVYDSYNKCVALQKAIKACATGNKGKSYWNGQRAFGWYCDAVRNCANAYYRLNRLCKVYENLCVAAGGVAVSDKSKDAAQTLYQKSERFKILKSKCAAGYKSVLDFGKS